MLRLSIPSLFVVAFLAHLGAADAGRPSPSSRPRAGIATGSPASGADVARNDVALGRAIKGAARVSRRAAPRPGRRPLTLSSKELRDQLPAELVVEGRRMKVQENHRNAWLAHMVNDLLGVPADARRMVVQRTTTIRRFGGARQLGRDARRFDPELTPQRVEQAAASWLERP